MDNIQELLRRPFEAKDIEWRVQQSGEKNSRCWASVLAYVTNRAIMDRLDEVFGVAGWKNSFEPTPSMDGVMCGISIKADGEWITKFDGAANTDIEAVKGGLSSAMKRTGVQFGIGRYLYHLESGFANVVEKGVVGAKYAKTKTNTIFYWIPPELPNWALPITKSQVKIINDLVIQKGADSKEMLKFYDVSDLNNATKEVGVSMIEALSKKIDKEKA